MATMLQLLDFLGVAVFAVTGGIVASRLRLDFLAFLFFAVFTGVGGGTLRDLVLGVPIFWVGNQLYLLVCLGIGAGVNKACAHLINSNDYLLHSAPWMPDLARQYRQE